MESIKTNLIISNEVFEDEAGNKMPYVAYTMYLSNEPFKVVPLKKDKKLINYLLTRNKLLEKGEYKTEITLSQEQFRDKTTRKYIDYVAYTLKLANKDFRLIVRDEDKLLVKYLLEEDYGFFVEDVNFDEEDDEDGDE